MSTRRKSWRDGLPMAPADRLAGIGSAASDLSILADLVRCTSESPRSHPEAMGWLARQIEDRAVFIQESIA